MIYPEKFNKSLIALSFMAAVGTLCNDRAVAREGKPNILFFFPDQYRPDWTSMNPAMPDVTPNLQKLANEGVVFSNAICPSPLCAPSRASLASGKQYDKCRVLNNAFTFPLDEPTFYQELRDEAGYHVLGCGKFDLDKPGKNWGIDGKHHRDGLPSLLNVWGFTDGIDNAGKADGAIAWKASIKEPYYNYLKKLGLIGQPMTDEAYTDNYIARNGLELIRSVPANQL